MSSPLNPEQSQALVNLPAFLHWIYQSLEQRSEEPDRVNWEVWKGLLVNANHVTFMFKHPGPIEWAPIAITCEASLGYLEALPATHNAHELLSAPVIRDVLAIARSHT